MGFISKGNVCAIILFLLVSAAAVFAGGGAASGLSIVAGTPPAAPAVAPVNASATANFTVALYDLDANKNETPAQGITGQSYTVAISGGGTSITAVAVDPTLNFTVTIAADKKSATIEKHANEAGSGGTNPQVNFNVAVTAMSTLPVNASITMNGSADRSTAPLTLTAPNPATVRIAWEGVYTIDYVVGTTEVKVNPITTNTLYVLKGTTARFHAVPAPQGNKAWPASKPVWGGTAGPTVDGTDPATATATFPDVTPQDPTTKKLTPLTVTAECGNTLTLNIVVFDIQASYTPDIKFTNGTRAMDKLGIMETATLKYTLTPTGLPLGGSTFIWAKSGVGHITSSTSSYAAQDAAGNATIWLQINLGPSKGQTTTPMPVTVLAPSGVNYVNLPNPKVVHIRNSAEIGIACHVYVLPTNVSFQNVKFNEGYCLPSKATGYYGQYSALPHNPKHE